MQRMMILILFIPMAAGAQDNTLRRKYDPMLIPKNNALKVNLLSPILFTLTGSYEHGAGVHTTLQHGVSYTHFYDNAGYHRITSFSLMQYTLDFRIYNINARRFSGAYRQPFIRYSIMDHRYFGRDTTGHLVNVREQMHVLTAGFVFGKQKVYNNKWLIDYYVGISAGTRTYFSANDRAIIKAQSETFKEFPLLVGGGIRTGLKIGYLF